MGCSVFLFKEWGESEGVQRRWVWHAARHKGDICLEVAGDAGGVDALQLQMFLSIPARQRGSREAHGSAHTPHKARGRCDTGWPAGTEGVLVRADSADMC